MNRRYAQGATLERQWCEDKRAQGYITSRTPGSKGAFDAWAVRRGDVVLAQMKYGGTSDMDGFGPDARKALARAARIAGGRAVLVRKRKGERGYREIPEEQWP